MMILILLFSLNLKADDFADNLQNTLENAKPITTINLNNKSMQKIGLQRRRVIKGPQIKNLNSILSKVALEEKRNLTGLLKQIVLIPYKENLSKVKIVEESSLWYREGIRQGDIVKLSN